MDGGGYDPYALARENLTLKAWFIREAERYVAGSQQPALFAAEASELPYETGTHRTAEEGE